MKDDRDVLKWLEKIVRSSLPPLDGLIPTLLLSRTSSAYASSQAFHPPPKQQINWFDGLTSFEKHNVTMQFILRTELFTDHF
jgi:hypothetical protein